MDNYQAEIINYYNSSQKDYELIWGLKKYKCLHYGYWDSNTKTHGEAVKNMTKKVANVCQLNNNDVIVDLGCGIGGPALYLCKKYGCQVHGISLATKQIAQANELATLENLTHKTNFTVQDYSHTNFENECFHHAYAIESSCYAKNKIDFLNEAFRIIKSNGKLIVLDFFWTGNEKSDEDKQLMQAWCDTWAIDNYAYATEFVQQAKQAGFKHVILHDISKHVKPSIMRLYYLFFPSLVADSLLRLIGKRRGKHKNMYSAYYQYKAYQKGLWKYALVEMVK